MADSDKINSNTSRNFDAEGKPLLPSVYEFEYIKFIRSRPGENQQLDSLSFERGIFDDARSSSNFLEVNVADKRLVTSLEIIEELYSPVVTAKMIIRDNSNFFEDFGLSGQEIVKVGINRPGWKENNDDNKIEIDFVVQDYSLFEKTTQSINVQEYHLNLISSVAFISRLQQISLSVKGSPVEGIKKIFKNYLPNVSIRENITRLGSTRGRKVEDKNKYECQITNLKTVITQRTPLQAIDWLKSCCYDQKESPFFVYPSTLYDRTIRIASWRHITDDSLNPIYGAGGTIGEKPYVFKPFRETSSPSGESDEDRRKHLEELASKVISIRSNLSLNKLQQTVGGGGPTHVTDVVSLNDRSYTQRQDILNPEYKKKYESDKGFTNLEPINFQYLQAIDGLNVNQNNFQVNNASRELFYLPVSQYGNNWSSSPELKFDSKRSFNHYKSTIESVNHEITIYGDEAVCPGTRIKIEIPKAVDTSRQEPGVDESLSGTYIVLVAVHTFRDGIYFNRLKITKDSVYNPKFNTYKI